MGAVDFEDYGVGSDVQKAFYAAREQAAHEFGHGGYTGTIAEKHDYVVIQKTPLPMSDASKLANKLMNEDDPRIRDKWGPAGAIPVVEEESVKRKEKTRTLTLDSVEERGGYAIRGNAYTAGAIFDQVAKEYPVEGYRLAGVEVLEKDQKMKNEVKTQEGDREIRYFVVPVTPPVIEGPEPTYAWADARTRPLWARGHGSQAAARSALQNHLDNQEISDYGGNEQEYEIIGIIRRSNGEPLIKGTRTFSRSRYKVRARYEEEVSLKHGIKPSGWLFFGWASS